MKHFLFSIFLFLSFSALHAQCEDIDNPCNIDYSNTAFVDNPDLETGQSALSAYLNNYYQTNFQVNIPTDTVVSIPGFGEVDLEIDYATIQNIEGLPSELTLDCSNSSCTFNGGESGCFSLSGTPTEIGEYNLNLVVFASLNFNGIPLEQALDDLIEITLIVEDCNIDGCYDENNTFYSIGESMSVNECEYVFCEGPNNWSDTQLVDDCNEQICDTLYVEVEVPVTVYLPVFITDTITETEFVDVIVTDTLVVTDTVIETEFVEVIIVDTIIETEFVEVIVTDTLVVTDTVIETEFIEVVVTDTVVQYQNIIVTEYVDCETFLPCESGIEEILDKSKENGKVYNLLGQEIIKREGIYIENGEVKYRLY